jgi:benzoyl-CoA reductase/2-hydroxyglutaryl-CoA dehydratase subunit BcrC/BadD/HgdB
MRITVLGAGELSREGKKIIGYICSFVPLEMITAAGCVPFRVRETSVSLSPRATR